MTASARSAEDAKASGLADVVVPDEALDQELRRQLRSLRRSLGQSVETIKHLTSVVPALDLAAALELGQQSTLATLRDPATIERIRRYKNDGVLPWEAS